MINNLPICIFLKTLYKLRKFITINNIAENPEQLLTKYFQN